MHSQNTYYEWLEFHIKQLVKRVFLGSDVGLEHVILYSEVGEYGLAFEELCVLIRKEKITVSGIDQVELFVLASVMGIESSFWMDLVDPGIKQHFKLS